MYFFAPLVAMNWCMSRFSDFSVGASSPGRNLYSRPDRWKVAPRLMLPPTNLSLISATSLLLPGISKPGRIVACVTLTLLFLQRPVNRIRAFLEKRKQLFKDEWSAMPAYPEAGLTAWPGLLLVTDYRILTEAYGISQRVFLPVNPIRGQGIVDLFWILHQYSQHL